MSMLRLGKAAINRTRAEAQRRWMGGGGAFMQTSETHRYYGEIFGVFAWLWVFHRARNDLPVVLGWRHPWDHDHDDHGHDDDHVPHGSNQPTPAQAMWDSFTEKAMIQKEVDDDEDEE